MVPMWLTAEIRSYFTCNSGRDDVDVADETDTGGLRCWELPTPANVSLGVVAVGDDS